MSARNKARARLGNLFIQHWIEMHKKTPTDIAAKQEPVGEGITVNRSYVPHRHYNPLSLDNQAYILKNPGSNLATLPVNEFGQPNLFGELP